MTHASASIGSARYAVSITTGKHRLSADEPADQGGMDAGPTPMQLLCSALGACTAITLTMYAARKGWPLRALRVDIRFAQEANDARSTAASPSKAICRTTSARAWPTSPSGPR